jgi:hypothetical protein
MPAPEPARRADDADVAPRQPESVLGDKENLPQKKVSGKAAGRLTKARDAIAQTKKAITFGAGNQAEAMKMSRLNSTYRLLVMRTDEFWEMSPEAAELANENPEAAIAAKADLAHGGNCGEHAWVAIDYLRLHCKGEQLAVSAKEGLDHAFVLMGDLKHDSDADIVVSDPWPTRARACLWEDHFAFTADRDKIDVQYDLVGDGTSAKAAIAKGLRLSAAGKHYVDQKQSQKDTDQAIEDEKMNIDGQTIDLHVWNHPNTEATGKRYNYTTE